MKSLTAFARANGAAHSMEVAVEVRSYNSRYLDILVRMPHDYLALEERIKKEVSQWMTRGRVEMAFSIQEEADPAGLFSVDPVRARAYHAVLMHLKQELELGGEIPLELVAQANGVVTARAAEKDLEQCWLVLQPCLTKAMQDLDGMRRREGDALRRDCVTRLEHIERRLKAVEAATADNVAECRRRLEERLNALISEKGALEPSRIIQEAALIAVKRDISEEITRSKSHLSQFRQIMDGSDPAGKKLNFLLQEIQREFNTLGTKAESTFVSHAVVEVKAELEKIREQIFNI